MEDLRSKSCGDGRTQEESYNNNGHKPNDLRCYSASYASSSYAVAQTQMEMGKGVGKLKKGTSKSWSLNEPELQRKKRVASYKAYTVEGKVKGSIRKGFRWFKDRYTHMVYGFR